MPLKIVEERQVGASLGADSIKGGVIAGIVGTALVILIMLGYYAVSGMLAVVALAFYVLFALGGLAMLEATLTLPGIAGLVLSIGIAVDANVLIFERIREELEHGKTVRLAVDEGFKHAMPAIIDSNVATVLTALFLFQFGTGPVKGFAVTLIMGIAASMISAVFITRTLYMIWLQRRPDATTAERRHGPAVQERPLRFHRRAEVRLRRHRRHPGHRTGLPADSGRQLTASSSPAAPWSRSRPRDRWTPRGSGRRWMAWGSAAPRFSSSADRVNGLSGPGLRSPATPTTPR